MTDNLYIIRNVDCTVDTMVCSDSAMVDEIATVGGYYGTMELTQISVAEKIDLDSTELRFNFRQSVN